MTAENQLHVGRIEQEHNQFGSDPQFAHCIVVAWYALLQNGFEYV